MSKEVGGGGGNPVAVVDDDDGVGDAPDVDVVERFAGKEDESIDNHSQGGVPGAPQA